MTTIKMDSVRAGNAAEIRARGADLHALFDELGHSLELTQARLRLEETLMWAVKHATRD